MKRRPWLEHVCVAVSERFCQFCRHLFRDFLLLNQSLQIHFHFSHNLYPLLNRLLQQCQDFFPMMGDFSLAINLHEVFLQ